jgi:hypothetical protein
MKYRADIDGLRALAVVPVMLFHAGVPFFDGGYVGIGVFFVISGFLITLSIVADENLSPTDRGLKLAIDRMRNFGFRDEVTLESAGGNRKMSEFNAALGSLQLKYFERVRTARGQVDQRYRAKHVFGPRQDPDGASGVIPKSTAAMINGEAVFINGDGEISRDFCFVDSAVRASPLAAAP